MPKHNFIKNEKKNRHYSEEKLQQIKRGKKLNKPKRGRGEVEYE